MVVKNQEKSIDSWMQLNVRRYDLEQILSFHLKKIEDFLDMIWNHRQYSLCNRCNYKVQLMFFVTSTFCNA